MHIHSTSSTGLSRDDTQGLRKYEQIVERSTTDPDRRRQLLQHGRHVYFAALTKVGADYAEALLEQMANAGV